MVPRHKKLLLSIVVVVLPISYFLGYTPILFPIIIVISSLLTYFVYAKDKAAATQGLWRVPQKTLHLLSLFFGWPGAIIAQERLRHKTKKLSFRVILWMTVFLNVAVVYIIHTPVGSKVVKQSLHNIERLITVEIHSNNMRDTLLFLIEIRR
jgi:uncharacterized membrane protein YsdA (DUF1294 family)